MFGKLFHLLPCYTFSAYTFDQEGNAVLEFYESNLFGIHALIRFNEAAKEYPLVVWG